MIEPMPVDILGIRVHAQTLGGAVDTLATWIDEREPHYACVTGVHGVVECQRSEMLRRIHNEAGMVTTDGMPLVWLSRRRVDHPDRVERVYGPDLMLESFARSETMGWRHFLYGSTRQTLDRLRRNLRARFPRADVVGAISPPFRPLTADEDAEMTEQIASARPDILWVGMSTPKQERWMAEHVHRLGVPALVGVGAAFDFHAGVTPQAPGWMQRAGLEWVYRLGREPRRLVGRYLRNNPRFVWLLARESLGVGRRSHRDGHGA